MPFRPEFNSYFSGAWDYDSSEGVGLKLTGFPMDLNKFIDLLHGESCNPVATRRILKELKEKNVKYTTLMSHLNFNFIGDTLKEIGVKMEIVPPISLDKVQNQELDYLAFDLFNEKQKFEFIQFGENDKAEIKSRLEIFTRSMEEYNFNFGPYDDDPKISRIFIEDSQKKKQSYSYNYD